MSLQTFYFVFNVDKLIFMKEHYAKPMYKSVAFKSTETIQSVAKSDFLR